MSSLQGDRVVAWLERAGERYLMGRQPEIYLQLLLHVGGTDTLRRYSGAAAYWFYVQAILDCFFSLAERAEICARLVDDPAFADDPSFRPFVIQAKAEIRCQELVSKIEKMADVPVTLRSTG